MDTVTTLRDLWRHRNAVVGVFALAVIVGVLVLYKFAGPLQLESRGYYVGTATASVLIDTPNSQVADLATEGSGELGARADLLSRLMAQGTLKARIARAAGLDPGMLYGRSLSAPDLTAKSAPPRGAPLLTTQVVNSNTAQLPLIQIEAQAGDVASATRLADAAVEGLRSYIDEQAADTRVPDRRRVRITRIGATQAELASRGPSNVLALIAGILVFCLGCACIAGLAALVRSWPAAPSPDERWPLVDVDGPRRPAVAEPQEPVPPSSAAVSPLRHVGPAPDPSSNEDEQERARSSASSADPKPRDQRQRRRSAS